jgi:hypothetical protein
MTDRRAIWPLGALALAFAVAGIALLIAAGPDALRLPFDDLALDEHRSTATGVAIGSEPVRAGLARIRYAFTDHNGARIEGSSWAHGDVSWRSGDEVVVEFLADDPHTNRLQGTLRGRRDGAVILPLGLLVLPSVILALLWLRGVMRRRVTAGEWSAT